jgi:hypothetical protein
MKAWRIAGSTTTQRGEVVVFAENGDRASGAGGGSPLAWADGDEIFIYGRFERA